MSRTLKPNEVKYTILEKDMLALTTALKRLRLYIHGYTIHISIKYKGIIKQFRNLAQIHRKSAAWILTINSFDVRTNLHDSRVKIMRTLQAPELTVTFMHECNYMDVKMSENLQKALKNLHNHQINDKKVKKIIDKLNDDDENHKWLKMYRYEGQDKKLLYRVLPDETKVPVLPDNLFYDVVAYLHEFYGHLGAARLELKFKRCFYAPDSLKTIKSITNACLLCKMNKTYTERKVSQFAPVRASTKGELVSIDIYGPLPNEKIYARNIIVAKDVFSKRIWLKVMTEATADNCVGIINEIKNDMEKKNIILKKVVTDNATQFTSEIWKARCAQVGVEYAYVTPYNPQSSTVERTMRELGAHFRLYINSRRDIDDLDYTHEMWQEAVAGIQCIINDIPTTCDLSPNEIWAIPSPQTPGEGLINFNKRNYMYEIEKILSRLGEFSKDIKNSTEIDYDKIDKDRDFLFDLEGNALITVDGACRDNGSENAVAGIGICFSPISKINVSQLVKHEKYRNSNNLAELMAIHEAIKIGIKAGLNKIKILTDSAYAVRSFNESITKWKKNKWLTYGKKIVTHKDLFQQIEDLTNDVEKIEYKHVYGHSYDLCNIIADKLAKSAVYGDEIRQLTEKYKNGEDIVENYVRMRQQVDYINMEHNYNDKYPETTNYQLGDLVLVSTHYQSKSDKRTIHKFYPKKIGPYEVKKKVCKNCYLVSHQDKTKNDEKIKNR